MFVEDLRALRSPLSARCWAVTGLGVALCWPGPPLGVAGLAEAKREAQIGPS